jgi:hypothetical protein
MCSFVARLALGVCMAVHVGNIQLALDVVANLVHLRVHLVEKGRHAAG